MFPNYPHSDGSRPCSKSLFPNLPFVPLRGKVIRAKKYQSTAAVGWWRATLRRVHLGARSIFSYQKWVGFGTEQGDESLETMLRAVPRVRFKKEET